MRQFQTGLVLVAMAGLFAVTAYVLLGAAGLAMLVGTGFLMLLFAARQEIRVNTSTARKLEPEDHGSIHDEHAAGTR